MKFNETKAIIKLAKNTEDEKLKEFLNQHYLNDDEEQKEVTQEVVEEPKVEEKPKEEKVEVKEQPKVEPKKEEVKKEENSNPQLEAIMNAMKEEISKLNTKIETIEKNQPKLKQFGAQPKQGEGKETKNFDTIFNNLNKKF